MILVTLLLIIYEGSRMDMGNPTLLLPPFIYEHKGHGMANKKLLLPLSTQGFCPLLYQRKGSVDFTSCRVRGATTSSSKLAQQEKILYTKYHKMLERKTPLCKIALLCLTRV